MATRGVHGPADVSSQVPSATFGRASDALNGA